MSRRSTVSYRQPVRGRALVLAVLLAGCAAPAPVGPLPDADGVQRRFLLTPGETELVSASPDDIPQIVELATRRSPGEIAERRRTEEIRLDQLAYFFRSPDGQAYLLETGPKALVRGAPAESCPVQVSIRSDGDDPRARGAIGEALAQCHADLAALGADPDCGCRLLAHDVILRADPAEFEYAIDLPTRLFRGGRLDPVTYFARAELNDAGERLVIVESGDTEIVRLLYTDPGARSAGARFPDGTTVEAVRDPVGFDRGRLRESFTLTDPQGARLRVIVGP
ncbi:hypothetical protein [Roseobacter sp. HKCCA0434]|uniref:hypothetical protein n=1 Tax=Roseobacter sp. HKCCA0434 TaxID=3079297 RepID=UPI0029058D7D|nr:hypothetical protein [Roseobacter sp. HKCCA0434]